MHESSNSLAVKLNSQLSLEITFSPSGQPLSIDLFQKPETESEPWDHLLNMLMLKPQGSPEWLLDLSIWDPTQLSALQIGSSPSSQLRRRRSVLGFLGS